LVKIFLNGISLVTIWNFVILLTILRQLFCLALGGRFILLSQRSIIMLFLSQLMLIFNLRELSVEIKQLERILQWLKEHWDKLFHPFGIFLDQIPDQNCVLFRVNALRKHIVFT